MSEESPTPSGQKTLVDVPNKAMIKILGKLGIEQQFRLRQVCTHFRDNLPLQIEFLKIIFCPSYAMMHIHTRSGHRTIFEYKDFEEPNRPSTYIRKVPNKTWSHLGYGSPAIHVASFLGRLLVNPNLYLAGFDVDFSRCTEKNPFQDCFPAISEMLGLVQNQISTGRQAPLKVQYLCLESTPNSLVPAFVNCFNVREFDLNYEESLLEIEELMGTQAWKGMKEVTMGKMKKLPAIHHFWQLKNLNLTLDQVSVQELWGMRESFARSPTLQQIKLFSQSVTVAKLSEAFGTQPDPDSSSGISSLWFFPIPNTQHTILITLMKSDQFPEDELVFKRLN